MDETLLPIVIFLTIKMRASIDRISIWLMKNILSKQSTFESKKLSPNLEDIELSLRVIFEELK